MKWYAAFGYFVDVEQMAYITDDFGNGVEMNYAIATQMFVFFDDLNEGTTYMIPAVL